MGLLYNHYALNLVIAISANAISISPKQLTVVYIFIKLCVIVYYYVVLFKRTTCEIIIFCLISYSPYIKTLLSVQNIRGHA